MGWTAWHVTLCVTLGVVWTGAFESTWQCQVRLNSSPPPILAYWWNEVRKCDIQQKGRKFNCSGGPNHFWGNIYKSRVNGHLYGSYAFCGGNLSHYPSLATLGRIDLQDTMSCGLKFGTICPLPSRLKLFWYFFFKAGVLSYYTGLNLSLCLFHPWKIERNLRARRHDWWGGASITGLEASPPTLARGKLMMSGWRRVSHLERIRWHENRLDRSDSQFTKVLFGQIKNIFVHIQKNLFGTPWFPFLWKVLCVKIKSAFDAKSYENTNMSHDVSWNPNVVYYYYHSHPWELHHRDQN